MPQELFHHLERWQSPRADRFLYLGSTSCMGESEYALALRDLTSGAELLRLEGERIQAQPGARGEVFLTRVIEAIGVSGEAAPFEVRAVETGALLRELAPRGRCWTLSPCDRYLLTCSDHCHPAAGRTSLVELESGALRFECPGGTAARDASAQRLVTLSSEGRSLALFDLERGAAAWEVALEPSGNRVCFSPCGAQVWVGFGRGGARALCAASGKSLEDEPASALLARAAGMTSWAPAWPLTPGVIWPADPSVRAT